MHRYHLDLRRDHILKFDVSIDTTSGNNLMLRIRGEGSGIHTFAIKTDNLELREPGLEHMELHRNTSSEFVLHAHIISPDTPWVAVVIPDGCVDLHREISGIAGAQQ